MKKILLSVLFLGFVFGAFGQDPSYIKRLKNWTEGIAQQGSYTYIVNIDVSSANWMRSDSVILCAVCLEDSGHIYISTSDADSVRLYVPDFQCYPVNATKVIRLGTTTDLRNKITGYGYKKK